MYIFELSCQKKMKYTGSTYSPTLDFAVVVNPLKEEPCLPMLVRAADLVGVEPTKVSILVVVPEVNPRSCKKNYYEKLDHTPSN